MKLRRPCGHKDRQGDDLYDKHAIFEVGIHVGWCNGGEFLPEDALVIENGEWPETLVKELARLGFDGERLPPADLVLADVATAYRQGVIDGKTEGYDEGYKAAMVVGDPGGFNGL